jgi:HlyD family type I secretion membrane fusion protein
LPTAFGLSVLLVSALGFGGWAAMAPLASAVVASGAFVATGQNKQVQHLEGGIIRQLLAREGDLVETGQPLLRLDDTAARAKLRRLVVRQYRVMAVAARLEAEIRFSAKMSVPAVLADEAAVDPAIKTIIEAQEAELKARQTSLLGQEEVLRREIAGLQESIRGYESQVKSHRARLAFFDEELKSKKSLLEQNLIKKSDVLALQRSEAGVAGELGELLGRIGDANERIARADQQIVQLRSAAIQKALEELRGAVAEHDDLQEQINAARDVVERIEVRAPVRGIIVKLHYNTPGGVVAPGSVILDLLPLNDELVIEARVNPSDITYIKEGQAALVRLTALNHRLTPMIEAKVLYVSADVVPEQALRTGTQSEVAKRVFIVRVRLDEDDTNRKVENFRPVPGMPADIYIETGQRTFFTYLLQPILDSFSRAFREH